MIIKSKCLLSVYSLQHFKDEAIGCKHRLWSQISGLNMNYTKKQQLWNFGLKSLNLSMLYLPHL